MNLTSVVVFLVIVSKTYLQVINLLHLYTMFYFFVDLISSSEPGDANVFFFLASS